MNEWNISFNTVLETLFYYYYFLTEDDLDEERNNEKQKHYLALDIEGDEYLKKGGIAVLILPLRVIINYMFQSNKQKENA